MMNQEELEKLISEVENEGLHQAPDYLESMIMKKVERIETFNSIEVLPIRNVNMEEWKKELARKKNRHMKMFTLKIAAGMTAAIAMLILMPNLTVQREAVNAIRDEKYEEERDAYFRKIEKHNNKQSISKQVMILINEMMEE